MTGSLGTSTDDLTNLLESDFGVWTLAGNVVQPILTGGRLRAEVRAREAEEREALGAVAKNRAAGLRRGGDCAGRRRVSGAAGGRA